MDFVEYEGHQVAYTYEGKGNPVMLVHGFCEDSSVWDEFQADLLEEGYRVIRVDLPGFGQSDVIPGISIEGMAKAVQAVLEALSNGPVVYIGHSMGGYVGLALARLYPESLMGMGLFHSHPYEDSEEKKANRQKSVEFIERQGHVLFVKQLLPSLFNENFANSNAFLLEKITYRAAKFDTQGIVAAQRAMAGRRSEEETLKNTGLPVLFIIGKEDQVVPQDCSMAQTHLPKLASIHILSRVAHMGMFEDRKKTQRIVRKFAAFCADKASA